MAKNNDVYYMKDVTDFNSVHKAIAYFYESGHPTTAVRKQANRALDKLYDGQKWQDLSRHQRAYFIVYEMKEYMFKKIKEDLEDDNQRQAYIRETLSKIEKKLEVYAKENYLETVNLLDSENKRNELVWEKFPNLYNKSDKEKLIAYENYVQKLRMYDPHIKPWNIDEWIECCSRNEDYHFRIYDQLMSMQVDFYLSEDSSYDPSTSEINDVVLKVILKIIEEDFRKTVDIDKIRNALRIINGFVGEFYEPYSEKDIEYIEAKKIIEELDFIIDLDS